MSAVESRLMDLEMVIDDVEAEGLGLAVQGDK